MIMSIINVAISVISEFLHLFLFFIKYFTTLQILTPLLEPV